MGKRDLTESEKKSVEQARAKHGKVWVGRAGDELVIVRVPTLGEHDRYVDKAAAIASGKKGTSAANTQRELALCCMVHPEDPAAKRSILDAGPPRAAKYVERALELSEQDDEELELEGN